MSLRSTKTIVQVSASTFSDIRLETKKFLCTEKGCLKLMARRRNHLIHKQQLVRVKSRVDLPLEITQKLCRGRNKLHTANKKLISKTSCLTRGILLCCCIIIGGLLNHLVTVEFCLLRCKKLLHFCSWL